MTSKENKAKITRYTNKKCSVQFLQDKDASANKCVKKTPNQLTYRGSSPEQYSHLVQKAIERSDSNVGIICGWNKERCSEFNDVFFSGTAKIVDLARLPLRIVGNALYFIVINIDQIGSTRKKIFDSKDSAFIKDVSRREKLVWVIDSVASFVSSGTLIEVFVEFVKMTKEFSESPLDVFVCDRNLYYTILFQKLYFNIQKLDRQNARQSFVKEMQEVFRLTNEQALQTGQYVNRARVCLKLITR